MTKQCQLKRQSVTTFLKNTRATALLEYKSNALFVCLFPYLIKPPCEASAWKAEKEHHSTHWPPLRLPSRTLTRENTKTEDLSPLPRVLNQSVAWVACATRPSHIEASEQPKVLYQISIAIISAHRACLISCFLRVFGKG